MKMDQRANLDTAPRPVFPDVVVLLGDWRLADRSKIERRFGATEFEAIERLKAALQELVEYRFIYLDNHENLLSDLLADPPDFVFNLCDTGYRNDALHELHIPALLEMLAIPYSGAGPAGLAICHDKGLVRAVASTHGVPVPSEIFVGAGILKPAIPFEFPALLKLNCGDGSLGTAPESVVHNAEEVQAQLARLRTEFPEQDVLVQEFLSGPEYSVGLIGNPGMGFTILPLLEVDYSRLDPRLPHILSYESKCDPQSLYWRQITYREAHIDEHARQRLIDYARLLFKRLGCRDYARFDFRADANGHSKLLDVNPNPAWCWDGKLNVMAAFAGYSYAELLRLLVAAAQKRIVTTGGVELVDDVSLHARQARSTLGRTSCHNKEDR
jgi:D-alanine-D-alanine ligase